MKRPSFNGAAALQFVVNGKAGSSDADATRDAIESGLREAGITLFFWGLFATTLPMLLAPLIEPEPGGRPRKIAKKSGLFPSVTPLLNAVLTWMSRSSRRS